MLCELIIDRPFVVIDQYGNILCTIEDDFIPYDIAHLEVLDMFIKNGTMLVIVYTV